MSDSDFRPKENTLLYKNLRKFCRAFIYSRRLSKDQLKGRVDLWLRLKLFRDEVDRMITKMETQLVKELDGRQVYKFQDRNAKVSKVIRDNAAHLELMPLVKKGVVLRDTASDQDESV